METTSRNVETVKGLYDSFAESDLEAVRAVLDPDVELREPAGFVGGRTFHGADDVVENVLAALGTDWRDVSVVPERFVADGDTVVSLYVWSGTSRGTGKSVEFPGAHVFEFEDGRIVRWTSYADTALFNAALEA